MDAADQPRSTQEAAGPLFKANGENPRVFTEEAVKGDAVAFNSLKDLLFGAKKRLVNEQAVTDGEMNTYLRYIFRDWAPGQFHDGPDKQSTARGANQCAYTFGRLRQTAPASARASGTRRRPRSVLERAISRQAAPRSTQPNRQAGAPVKVMVEHRGQGTVSFSLRDSRNGILAFDNPVDYTECTKEEAYFRAMMRNDNFMAVQVDEYNVNQAIYMARNRLTYWSDQNVEVGQSPPGETMDLAFAPIMMCRDAAEIASCPQAAEDRIRATPIPRLFTRGG